MGFDGIRRPGTIDAEALEGVDAIVHLAGESIGEKKWTDEQKRAIRDSRVGRHDPVRPGARRSGATPEVLVSGSAIGWYGNRGDEVLTETSPPPDPGLPPRCLRRMGSRHRTGRGGRDPDRPPPDRHRVEPEAARWRACSPPFKLGLGGRIGSGGQYMSWISLEDEVGAILHAIDTPTVHGALNATAPNPVTNREFTKTLGHALHRPDPAADAARPAQGAVRRELVQNLLVDGQRVIPAQLLATGYEFRHPDLAGALASMDL